ncbi:MAG: glgE2, partial [Verrucomicrobiales bacterium]|nr:glgE2 [Verrucomicrobiales bacterium]
GGRVFLDVVINHTGWGSTLQEDHPEWFLREGDLFVSPGAWGNIWEDLVEINHGIPDSWECLAQVFLTWCSRGVDGFRCDAGYKVPMPAWRYITARVREQFPDALFLLEGLGGAWEATENLLGEGGMQWAYSELFQNYSGVQVAEYLDHSFKQNIRAGLLVHYSETHDNDRLAKKGRAWALMRNQLSALASSSGGYGFTCGVEWMAAEKVNVHSSRGLSWGNPDNLLAELNQLNSLLANHPCFYDGAILKRLSSSDSSVYVLRRDCADGSDRVLIVINLDDKEPHTIAIPLEEYENLGRPQIDLLRHSKPLELTIESKLVRFTVPPAAAYCFAQTVAPNGIAGDTYKRARARSAWAVQALSRVLKPEEFGQFDWFRLSEIVDRDPARFLGAIAYLDVLAAALNLTAALESTLSGNRYAPVVVWQAHDRRRISLVPSDHCLLIRDPHPFQVQIRRFNQPAMHLQSIVAADGSIVSIPPFFEKFTSFDARIILNRLVPGEPKIEGDIRFLAAAPGFQDEVDGLTLATASKRDKTFADLNTPLALLTNGLGGMARMSADFGRIKSKYDCVLGANLHAEIPVDRHIFVKRVRAWVNANGFIKALDGQNLLEFRAGPPACWRFIANAGAGQALVIELTADMLQFENTTVLRFRYLDDPPPGAAALPIDKAVHLVIRVDIEDRNFHFETKHNGGADFHFSTHCQSMDERPGFRFTPAANRALQVYASVGQYHPQPEWCDGIAHPVEVTRGQIGSGDAFSPGWFELPIQCGQSVTLISTAEIERPSSVKIDGFEAQRSRFDRAVVNAANLPADDHFGRQLARASQDFVVRRHSFKTVIAGYPWFLDWGRDSLICARGLLAAGMVDEVVQLLITFGRFEKDGTLPNTIHGEDASNRDTSDAPMWYGLVCEETAAIVGEKLYATTVDSSGRTVADVLLSLANGYKTGTPNGIRMDANSGLIWSPPHFTWMDTNYPAGTPRAGYPVEIQALWIRLLCQISRLGTSVSSKARWREIAALSEES